MINGKYVVGIVGGIGAGKSTVLNYVTERYRAEAIAADEVGRLLMQPGRSVYYALTEVFGDGILNEEGRIDTAKLSSIVFADADSQKKVNGLEHPLIKSEIESMIADAKEDVVFLEAALLIEGGLKQTCDEIWLVKANKETRIRRLMQSRGYTRKRCEQIIALQLSEREMKKHVQSVIDNGSTDENMRKAVDLKMTELSGKLDKTLSRA